MDPVVIDKNKDLLPAQDYAFLREKGMEYIRELSGQIWTDHNLHDPGVTTLEVLCYALTDLGYRTGFDLQDLLTRPDGQFDPTGTSGLFPAHEVLPTSPLTIYDYRRLLLKIEGVRNAWLDPMMDPPGQGKGKQSEIPVYADCQSGELSFEPTNALGQKNQPLQLNGLYKVLLELEIDDQLGSLNETRLVYQVPRGSSKGVIISLDSTDPAFLSGEIDFGSEFQGVDSVLSVTPNGPHFDAQVRVNTASGAILLNQLTIRVINARLNFMEEDLQVLPADIEAILADNLEGNLSALFWKKQTRRAQSIAAVCCALDAHRNLSEDFLSIETVQAEGVSICADIELKADADIEEVQAQVFHAIEQYLNPSVRYFSLQEMLADGYCSDEIFNGPYIDPDFRCEDEHIFTKPGFIKTEDLTASELRRFIYVSDLINILMDFEEVISVKNVLLRKYDLDGNPIGDSEKWCLEVTPGRQGVLSIEQSKILFFKNEVPYRARRAEFQKTLDHLRAMARKAAYVAPHQVLAVPPGRYRQPGAFFSIQHDYPRAYGIGEAGLPTHVQDARLAQARQLKAYLTVYDQVLADYLAQLENVRRFFSLDKNLAQSYFSQYLDQIAGVRQPFDDEFYVDKNLLQQDLSLARLTEDESNFQERRSRTLDHLLARFAEQFTDYVLMMFNLEGDPLKTADELIEDKIDFLSEYPVVSRERGKAFNYRQSSWNSSNVSGLEKRISRLVGIDNYQRRDLACAALPKELFRTRKMGGQFRVEVKDGKNKIIFKSVELFATRQASNQRAMELFPFVRQESSYQVVENGGIVSYALSGGGVTLTNDEQFDTEADAVQDIRQIIDRYDEILQTHEDCDQEGMHLIEHILLRPQTLQDDLMPVCLDPDCESCGDEDPYSFRISVVLPYWPDRFQNLDFRRFFERLLREETPAHLQVRVCWVSHAQMAELDARYQDWLVTKSMKEPDQNALTAAQNDLIEILSQLNTVYPAASLHDCLEDEDEYLVQLGSTNLGIF